MPDRYRSLITNNNLSVPAPVPTYSSLTRRYSPVPVINCPSTSVNTVRHCSVLYGHVRRPGTVVYDRLCMINP